VDAQTIAVGMTLFVAGLVVGRLTAPKERTTTIYQPAPARETVADAGADAEIDALLRRGNKIEAIKRYRETYGTGLKEAKDAVEAIEARLGA
jgi:large subunit ribosomal protein L7/L12